MTRDKKIGIFLIIFPIVLLTITLFAYAVTRFVISSSVSSVPSTYKTSTLNETTTEDAGFEIKEFGSGEIGGLQETSRAETTAKIINVVLGLVGLLAVLITFITVPLGIYFLSKKDQNKIQELQKSTKFQHLTPEQIQFASGWSWGAFFSTPIWALGNKLYLWTLLSLLPLVNIYAWIKLSIDGRKMSWEEGNWSDFDQFKQRQKIVAIIIVVVTILYVIAKIMTEANPYS